MAKASLENKCSPNLRNTYLAIENCILRNQIKGRGQLNDGGRQVLAESGQKLGKQALEEVATMAKPGTILTWHRKFVTQKGDGSKSRKALGRPRVDQELEVLMVLLPGVVTVRYGMDLYDVNNGSGNC